MNPERMSPIRLKIINQRFRLSSKPGRDYHPPIHVSFPKIAYIMHSKDMTDVLT
jgi:hypothetical protein